MVRGFRETRLDPVPRNDNRVRPFRRGDGAAVPASLFFGLVNSLLGLVLAHTILALPLTLMIVSAALKSYDLNQKLAARGLRVSRLTAFLTVTLPQIRFSIITSALLAFLTSFDEVIVAMFVSGGDNSTLTRNMFNALRDQIDPTIAAISTIMIVISSTLVILTQVFGKSKD